MFSQLIVIVLILFVLVAHGSSDNPINNIYFAMKTINLFTSSDVFDYVIDGLEPTYLRNCVRPFNNVNTLIPDQYCDSFKGPIDKAVHFSFVHARNEKEFTMHYQESLEFDLGISVFGGASIDLFDVGVLQASRESEWAVSYFKSVGVNAFIGTDKTYCYEVTFSDLYPMTPAYELRQRIINAPLVYDPVYFTGLIAKIGTHIAKHTKFGAAMVEVGFAGEKTMEASFSTEQSMSISAQENLWFVSATEKDSIHLSVDATTYNHIIGANYNVYFKGPTPSSNDQKKYNEDACADPQPLQMKLIPIPYTLTTANYPDVSVEQLNATAINLVQGMKDYCSYYPCYHTPNATVASWEPVQTVVGVNRKKLIREDEGVCILSEIRKLTYASCSLEIGAHEVGDSTRYWYLNGAGTSTVVCSALCSKSVGWLKNKGGPINPREYAVSLPGGKESGTEIALEPDSSTVCTLVRVYNEFICNDRCSIYQRDGRWYMSLHVGKCYDDKHMEDKEPHGCHAYCYDTTRIFDNSIQKKVNFKNGVVPIALANETYCHLLEQQLAGSFLSDKSTGGGCILAQQKVEGRDGVYWTLQAIKPTASIAEDWCYDECGVTCTSLN